MLDKTLDLVAQTGSDVQKIMAELDALGALDGARYGSSCVSIVWHQGPQSKGWPQTKNAHVTTPQNGSGHDILRAQHLSTVLEKAEDAFFEATNTLSKVMAKTEHGSTTRLFPAFRFEIGALGGSCSFDLLRDIPSRTWAGSTDFYFPDHWDIFCSILKSLKTLKGVGIGKSWVIAQPNDSSVKRGTEYAQSFPVKAKTAEAAFLYGKIKHFPNAFLRPRSLVLLEPHKIDTDLPIIKRQTTWSGETRNQLPVSISQDDIPF